jgi:hypothetical protein
LGCHQSGNPGADDKTGTLCFHGRQRMSPKDTHTIGQFQRTNLLKRHFSKRHLSKRHLLKRHLSKRHLSKWHIRNAALLQAGSLACGATGKIVEMLPPHRCLQWASVWQKRKTVRTPTNWRAVRLASSSPESRVKR